MLSNPRTEDSLLSCFLTHPQSVGALCVERRVLRECFTTEENKTLYSFLLGVWGSGTQISPHTIAYELKKSGELSTVGGVERLQALTLMSVPQSAAPTYIQELQDLCIRRKILQGTKRAYEDVQGDCGTDSIIAELRGITESSVDESIPTPTPSELNRRVIESAESTDLISTGFRGIDKQCGSLRAGDFLVIGGGAKAGKSTLAANIASHIAKSGFVAIFTIEMNADEYWKRMINAEASITSTFWDPKEPTIPSQQQRAGVAMTNLSKRSMTIVDRVVCIEQAWAMARALKAKHGNLRAVVIDYLQLFSAPRETATRAELVSHISRTCKRAATGLQTLAIGLSQLNDNGKSLDSRSIQMDANLMLNVTVDEDGGRTVTSEFNRNGPMGITLPLKAELHFNRFVDV